MRIGEIVKQYREAHGISQRQFADMCSNQDGSISNGYISMVESGVNPSTGKPLVMTIEKAALIAHGMNMSLHQLIELADDAPVSVGSASEKLQAIGDSLSAVKNTEEWRSLAPGWANMTKEERQRVVAVVKAMFPNRFDGKDDAE